MIIIKTRIDPLTTTSLTYKSDERTVQTADALKNISMHPIQYHMKKTRGELDKRNQIGKVFRLS